MTIKHDFTSSLGDGSNSSLIRPSDWNASHGGTESYTMNFRLSLESTVPVSTTDQENKETLYMVPYLGNQIALYDGSSSWTVYTSGSMSLSISTYTQNTNYDIWCYANSGTPTMDSTAWSGSTVRDTALTTQDGVLVKTGATDRRYIGTIRITSSGSQCTDSEQYRYVYNYYNRIRRTFRKSGLTKAASNYAYFVVGDPAGTASVISGAADFAAGGQTGYADVYVYSSIIPSGAPGHFEFGVRAYSSSSYLIYDFISRSDTAHFPTGYGYINFTPVTSGANSNITNGVIYGNMDM